MHFKITESISSCNANTGKPIRQIKSELMDALWPNSSEDSQYQRLLSLIKGDRKGLSLTAVHIICTITGVDANFLCDIKKTK